MTKHSAPPALAEIILRTLLPSRIREPLLGDLAEQHEAQCRTKSQLAADWWYWNEMVAAAAHALAMCVRNAVAAEQFGKETVVGTDSRQIVRATVVLFLPTVVAVMLLIPAVDRLIRHGSLLEGMRGLHLPLVIGGPLLLAAGYGLVLILFRRHFRCGTLESKPLHVASAALAVVMLGLLSILTQGAHLPFILLAHFGAGAGAALSITSRSLWQRLRTV